MSHSTTQERCSHCGRPSPTVICASCFLNYDPRQYEKTAENDLRLNASPPVRKNLWNNFSEWDIPEEEELENGGRIDSRWDSGRYADESEEAAMDPDFEEQDDSGDEGGSFLDWLSRKPRFS